ncbi:MAG TPA: M13 family metallopeptidase N-terminal domain-containing protein, partial [Pyrinomonadaceae bacterium]|nr:M13 family metallopeptidase N-terminal domain-containing protein [Pyrinomonadaceae bacterium]
MKRFRNSLFASALTIVLCALVVFAQTPAGRGLDVSNIDKNANPCADFYQYANGGWLTKNTIPAAYPEWGVFDVLAEQNRTTLRQIIEDAAKNTSAARGSNEQKVGDFYA